MKSKYFKIQELVPSSIYYSRKESAWELIDSRLIITLDYLREKYGPILINNWNRLGALNNRGFRDSDTNVGAKLSQHRYGRAADCSFLTKGILVKDVRDYIIMNPTEFPFITCIEMNVSWLHFDVRNHNLDHQIMLIYP